MKCKQDIDRQQLTLPRLTSQQPAVLVQGMEYGFHIVARLLGIEAHRWQIIAISFRPPIISIRVNDDCLLPGYTL